MGSHSRAAYRLLNTLTGRRVVKTGRIRGATAADRLHIFQQQFSKTFAPNPQFAKSVEDLLRDVHKIREIDLFPTDPPTFRVGPYTLLEVEAVLRALQVARAAGVDEIPPEVFKIPGIAPLLLPFLNMVLESGEVPDEWKVLLMVPVPKKGDLSDPANYRGISLMCILAKVYNKLLLFRLRDGLENKLGFTQNGFRPGRSTVQHITLLRMLSQYALSHPNVTLVMLFIDYSKAFDSVNWTLLEEVLRAYKVPANLVKAIMSLYNNPSARIRTPEGLSDAFSLFQGVLQGDTLAPYLFIIVMDFIMRRALENLEHLAFSLNRESARYNTRGAASAEGFAAQAQLLNVGFADDYALCTGGSLVSLELAFSNMQVLLSALEPWGKLFGLDMNYLKTVFLAIAGGKVHSFPASDNKLVLLSGVGIPGVEDFKYLGSYLLRLSDELKGRLHSAWVTIRKSSRFFKADNVSTDARIRVFSVIAQSIFMYACPSWIMVDADRKLLQGAYTRMLRFVRNIPFTDHPSIDAIYGDVPSILAQVTRQRMRMLGRTFRPIVACPQPLTGVLSWMMGEPQTTDTVRATLGARRKTQSYRYDSQLLLEVREITGRRSISSMEVMAMLRGNTWKEKVTDQVYTSRSKLFARAPLSEMRSVFQVFRTPPLVFSSNNLKQRPSPGAQPGEIATVQLSPSVLNSSGVILDTGSVGPDMDDESVDGDIEAIGGRFEECSIAPRKRSRQLIAFTPDSELSPPGTINFSSSSLSDPGPRADDETEIVHSPPRARPRRSIGGQRALHFY